MEIVNKVAQSGIITIDMERFFPEEPPYSLDISQFLFKGLLLKEIDFRSALKTFDWSVLKNKNVAVFCGTDAIIPQWAYMLIGVYLEAAGAKGYFGNIPVVEQQILLENLRLISADEYKDQKVVIKGCGTRPLPDAAYLEISKKLLPVVKSLMFGEPCSTVPIYKKK
jgi:hypothetical protein